MRFTDCHFSFYSKNKSWKKKYKSWHRQFNTVTSIYTLSFRDKTLHLLHLTSRVEVCFLNKITTKTNCCCRHCPCKCIPSNSFEFLRDYFSGLTCKFCSQASFSTHYSKSRPFESLRSSHFPTKTIQQCVNSAFPSIPVLGGQFTQCVWFSLLLTVGGGRFWRCALKVMIQKHVKIQKPHTKFNTSYIIWWEGVSFNNTSQ